MAKRVALVVMSESWVNGQHLITARHRGARGHLGEICRVTAPIEKRDDAKWRAACEGMDRGFEVREAPAPRLSSLARAALAAASTGDVTAASLGAAAKAVR